MQWLCRCKEQISSSGTGTTPARSIHQSRMAGFSDTTPQYAYLATPKKRSEPALQSICAWHDQCASIYSMCGRLPSFNLLYVHQIGWVMQGDIYPWIQTEERYKIGPFKNISVTSEAGSPSWDVTHGSWHAADWLQQIIPAQVAAGDVVWSPFVAAGWSEREELNARPAQWLGLLKLLTVSADATLTRHTDTDCLYGLEHESPSTRLLRNPLTHSPAHARALRAVGVGGGVLLHGVLLSPPTLSRFSELGVADRSASIRASSGVALARRAIQRRAAPG